MTPNTYNCRLLAFVSTLLFTPMAAGEAAQSLGSKAFQDSCYEIKGGFDIGSGTTKAQLALVNSCSQKHLLSLYKDTIKVGYQNDLENNDWQFSAKILDLGTFAMNLLKTQSEEAWENLVEAYDIAEDTPPKAELISYIKNHMPAYPGETAVNLAYQLHRLEDQDFEDIPWTGVATSAFRRALNGKQSAKKLSHASHIEIKVVTQSNEARLGFVGALAKYTGSASNQKVIVWDIGGGSMQFSSISFNESLQRQVLEDYAGATASVKFKNFLIKRVKGDSPQKVASPNPISRIDAIRATIAAKRFAGRLPKNLKSKIKTESSVVIGIGGVHYHSILKQVNQFHETPDKEFYTRLEVLQTARDLYGKNDAQINSNYADTQLSNLLLVLGYMESLQIDKVLCLNVNMTDAAILGGI